MDVKDALKKYDTAKTYWSEIYSAMRDDVRFSIGLDHYPSMTEQDCRDKGLLVVPILPQFIHQVVNDMRVNTPSITVLPTEDSYSDIETAKIYKGLIKSIEYKSNADDAYDTAGEYSVRGGLGFAMVDHDYVAEDSFLQELKIKSIRNQSSVYLDPTYMECDGSDAEWGLILEKISKEEFEEKYSGKEFASFGDTLTEDAAEITICQFFIKKYTEITKQMAVDGSMEDYSEEDEEAEKKKKKRKLRKVTIERYKFSGSDELEKTTFPGIYIPIVPFHGEEVWDDGKRYLMSLIRQAKDAQRRVNKWATKESQLLDMAPISPVQAPVGSVDDFMDEWGSPEDKMVLRYRMQDTDGSPLNKPERLPAPQIPTGFVNAMQEATNQAKQAMGMYDASLGQRSNETSGLAINARKVEGETATFHFADNRARSIRHIGVILVCAIPYVYDSDRIIQIIGEEDEPKMIGINGAMMQDGQDREYDLRIGKFDTRVELVASNSTKRQEAAALLGDVLAKTPALMGVIGDLYFKNLDVAGAEAIAERVKKTIPKELLADEEAKLNGEQLPPDPEKEEMAQIIEQLQAALSQAEQQAQSKQGEDQAKMREMDIKQQEVQIKQQEVGVKESDMRLKYLQAAAQTAIEAKAELVPNAEELVEALYAKMQMEVKTDLPVEDYQQVMKDDMQRQEMEFKVLDMQQRAEQSQIISATLGDIAGQIQQLSAQVSQPITVVRDESGAIIGAQ